MQLADPGLPQRILHGAFHDHVRAVFAQHSDRSRLLRDRRATWLHRLSRQFITRVSMMNLYSRD